MIIQIFLFVLVNIFLFKIKPNTLLNSKIICAIWIILLLLIPPILIIPSFSIMDKETHIENTQEKIKELKVEYYNLEKKDGNQEKLHEKEQEIEKIEENLIKNVNDYNEILEKDKQRFILFRLHFFKEKIILDGIETNDQYIVPDYYKG